MWERQTTDRQTDATTKTEGSHIKCASLITLVNVIHLYRVPNMGVFLIHQFYHVTEGRILVVNWLQICSYGCLYIACVEESHTTVSMVLSICSMKIWDTGDPYSDFLSLLVPSLSHCSSTFSLKDFCPGLSAVLHWPISFHRPGFFGSGGKHSWKCSACWIQKGRSRISIFVLAYLCQRFHWVHAYSYILQCVQ